MVAKEEDLRAALRRIDGRGYKAYKSIAGSYQLEGGLTLHIDHVQGDPFAAPSRVRIAVTGREAGIPDWATSSPARRVALADLLTRAFSRTAAREQRTPSVGGSGKSGLVEIETPSQEVLARSSVALTGDGGVVARIRVGLPARGRTVLGRQASELLLSRVSAIARASLRFAALDEEAARRHVECVEDQRALRAELDQRGLVAFVGDGARLPRRSGVDQRPMDGEVVAFESPSSLATEIRAPNAGPIRGMGIPAGITLIVGGGYHGKSTLLSALARGAYDHIPGDGRERVVTRSDAVKIRAEDGRRIENVNISPFIRNLPLGGATTHFRSDDASGSTSQAANIMEALEVGASLLLIDEDTSATNFMIRDHRMQALVATDKEPIVPFIDKVRQLETELSTSTILVVGGAGDYFDVADTVVMMDEYRARDVTDQARAIAAEHRGTRRPEGGEQFGEVPARHPRAASVDPRRGKRDVVIDVRGNNHLGFGEHDIDLSAIEQLAEPAQLRAIGRALVFLRARGLGGGITLAEALSALDELLDAEGLEALGGERDGSLARPRRFEIAAALNRLRSLRAD